MPSDGVAAGGFCWAIWAQILQLLRLMFGSDMSVKSSTPVELGKAKVAFEDWIRGRSPGLVSERDDASCLASIGHDLDSGSSGLGPTSIGR